MADVTHVNSIQFLDRAVGSIAPKGSVLISSRELNQIMILDPLMKEVLWSWGEKTLQGQHHATLLDNDNILLFDNGTERRQSRLIEVNPLTRRVEWSFTAPTFFT